MCFLFTSHFCKREVPVWPEPGPTVASSGSSKCQEVGAQWSMLSNQPWGLRPPPPRQLLTPHQSLTVVVPDSHGRRIRKGAAHPKTYSPLKCPIRASSPLLRLGPQQCHSSPGWKPWLVLSFTQASVWLGPPGPPERWLCENIRMLLKWQSQRTEMGNNPQGSGWLEQGGDTHAHGDTLDQLCPSDGP